MKKKLISAMYDPNREKFTIEAGNDFVMVYVETNGEVGYAAM